MRTLKFIVDDQIIRPDPNCDFDNLVPGSEGYLKAEFSFSPGWDGYVKVAAFYSPMGFEYMPQALVDNKCTIPAEALEKRVFKVQVVGGKGDLRLRTNKLRIDQNGGKR